MIVPGRRMTERTAASSSTASPGERTTRNPIDRNSEPKNNLTSWTGSSAAVQLANSV